MSDQVNYEKEQSFGSKIKEDAVSMFYFVFRRVNPSYETAWIWLYIFVLTCSAFYASTKTDVFEAISTAITGDRPKGYSEAAH